MKFFESFEEDDDDYEFEEEKFDDDNIEKIKIDGIYYHGTTYDKKEGKFTSFDTGYSDFNATWFCDDEHIAEMFSDNKSDYFGKTIQIVYKVQINSEHIANVNWWSVAKELMEFLSTKDFRECYGYIQDLGYDGCLTSGSIGSEMYDDLAIFDLYCVKILSYKTFKNGKWSKYVAIK
jgi:hypothetical protein